MIDKRMMRRYLRRLLKMGAVSVCFIIVAAIVAVPAFVVYVLMIVVGLLAPQKIGLRIYETEQAVRVNATRGMVHRMMTTKGGKR